jgi:hypothetical protein
VKVYGYEPTTLDWVGFLLGLGNTVYGVIAAVLGTEFWAYFIQLTLGVALVAMSIHTVYEKSPRFKGKHRRGR